MQLLVLIAITTITAVALWKLLVAAAHRPSKGKLAGIAGIALFAVYLAGFVSTAVTP